MIRPSSVYRLVAVCVLFTGCWALPAAERKTKEYEVKLVEPLVYGGDKVEVTADGNLRRRYRVWGDWDAEVAAWLKQARENAAARGTPARKLKVGCVFLKDARISSTDTKGDDDQPLTGTYTTPPKFVEEMKTKGMQDYCDFMFAFSGGELEVEWVVATLEGLHWQAPGTNWGCQPRAIGDQVLKALEKHKDDDVAMWMFCAGKPATTNSKDKKKQIGAPPYGISYTQWPIYGGMSLVISQADVGLMVHEFNHRYLDNLPSIEGVHLTRFHGLAALGYHGPDCGYPGLLNTYRSVYQYIVRRDMWRRFTLKSDVNKTPKEPFAGKAYAWDDVKHDCWFKLPELTKEALAQLTGVPSFTVDAPKGQPDRRYGVGQGDRGKVMSPYLDALNPDDKALNNNLAVNNESCAVLKTPTGLWLFVKPDVADLYVEMDAVAGRGKTPLQVYGYVNEGIQPLIAMKAPADMALPANERGFFGAGR
jgi:hypothetical protein